MADGVQLKSDATTVIATAAADEIGGFHYQRVKLVHGPDGVNDGDVSSANPLPVTGTFTATVDSEFPAAAALADNTPNPTTTTVGAMAHVWDGSNWDRLPGTTADGALVNLGANNDVTVTGAVTANAGTNLNTSLLALEAGGNLAAAATSLAALDNAVAGNELQVDVVGALPAGTNNIGDVDVASIAAGDNNIGNVDIVTVPADPFGVNADAASATGSISAKLRFIAATGIPITGTATVSGTVTANAGTNLNTSALALESGGNLAAAAASLALIDNPVATLGTTTYTEATTNGYIIGAVRRDADTTLVNTTNEIAPLQVDANGYLKVEIFDGGGSHTVDVASGGIASGALASGSIAAGAIADMIVDDAAFTPATSRVMMAGFQADETATDSVDEGDAGAARMTLDRKQIVTTQPHTAGGLSTFMASGSDGSTILSNAAQVIKASAGQLYGYYIYNPNSSATFVHFYNTAAGSVTVGTTNPLFTLTIPATSAANLMGTMGVAFSNAGWSIATTTTAGGNSAPATGLDAVVWYA